MFELNDIVVFKKPHKWAGCIGFIDKIEQIEQIGDINGKSILRLRICVPALEGGTAYIYATTDTVEKVEGKYPSKLEGKSNL